MRRCVLTSLALIAVGASLAVCFAQLNTPAQTVQWDANAPDSSTRTETGTTVKVSRYADAQVSVSLRELWGYYRAEIQVLNLTDSPVEIDPAQLTLTRTKPGEKNLSNVPSDKVIKELKVRMDSNAQAAASRGLMDTYAAPVTGDWQRAHGAEVDKQLFVMTTHVRETALRQAAVLPRQTAVGAVYFRFEKKLDAAILRVPFGKVVFEFPFRGDEISR